METTEIGYISKTHALKGQVVLRLNEYIDIEENIKSIFLEINGSQVPFFVTECNPVSIGYILKIETIDNVDLAKKLVGKKAFVLPEFIIENEDSLQEFVGYTVLDTTHGNVGIINQVDEKTENVTITIIHQSGKEIILPFNDDFILSINDEIKQIEFDAPEGLIEMYLS